VVSPVLELVPEEFDVLLLALPPFDVERPFDELPEPEEAMPPVPVLVLSNDEPLLLLALPFVPDATEFEVPFEVEVVPLLCEVLRFAFREPESEPDALEFEAELEEFAPVVASEPADDVLWLVESVFALVVASDPLVLLVCAAEWFELLSDVDVTLWPIVFDAFADNESDVVFEILCVYDELLFAAWL